jgi:hypothetical protein
MNQESLFLKFEQTNSKFTKSSLLPNNLPHLEKTRSAFVQNNLYKSDIGKSNSLREQNGEKNQPAGFKLIWLLNHLTNMEFNMNICYRILETINLDEDLQVEDHLNAIINRYFSNEFLVEENNEPKKDIATRLFEKIFNGKNQMKMSKAEKQKSLEAKSKKKDIPEYKIDLNHIIIPIEDEPRVLKSNKMKCQICYEDQSKENFFKMLKCNHEFCLPCVIGYITQKINCNQTIDIKCPTECGEIFPEVEIKKILQRSPDLYDKYEKFSTMAKLNKDPNVRWCVTPECKGYMIGDKSNNKLVCGICKNAMCFLCRNAWHDGLQCEDAMNIEFKKYIERVEVKECPKCKTKIEKNEGCNHMTCTRCNYQFCWICCKQYTKRHYKWYNLMGCPKAQFSQRRKKTSMCEVIWVLLKVFFIGIFSILAGALFLAVSPLILLWLAYYLPFLLCYEVFRPKRCESKVLVYLSCFLVATLLLPITVLLIICPGSCFYIYDRIH